MTYEEQLSFYLSAWSVEFTYAWDSIEEEDPHCEALMEARDVANREGIVKPRQKKPSWQWEWADKQASCPWCDYYRLDGKRCGYGAVRRRCERKRCPTRDKR
jgi:hypothetical protein